MIWQVYQELRRGFESFTTELDLEEETDWSGVLCLGMGGSGAGGLFRRPYPMTPRTSICCLDRLRSAQLVGPEWLVIATSYSGNTEETSTASGGYLCRWNRCRHLLRGELDVIFNPKDRRASMCLRAKCPALPLGISSGLNYRPVGHWEFSKPSPLR